MHFLSGEKGFENLSVCEASIPVPGEDEVLIKVLSSSINRIDLMQANGTYPIPPGVTQIGGLDCSGYMVHPTTLQPLSDELVFALLNGGGYSQYATCHKDLVLKAPQNLSTIQLAAIPEVWITAYQLLKFVLQAEENAGKVALVYAAASGVGTSLIQLCKFFGIKSIAVSSSKDKLDVCSALGADYTINYKEANTPDLFIAEIMKFTDGKGVDYIIDPICAQNFQQNLKCIGLDAKWVVYGFLGGFNVENGFDMRPLFSKRG